MNKITKKFSDAVLTEMKAMKEHGAFIPELAWEQAADLDFIVDYEYMDVNACADLIISLAQI